MFQVLLGALTANSIASIWTDVLGKPISYAGDDLDMFEKSQREHVAPAMTLDISLMFDSWQKIGILPMPGAIERLTAMLERPLRTYRAFAEETAAQWLC